MNNLNPILENLKQRTVQEAPVKLIYAKNDFVVFDKGTSDFYGAEDEYISDQPLEG
ncbi:2244_t:CDS:1, partial [Racocetra persica]